MQILVNKESRQNFFTAFSNLYVSQYVIVQQVVLQKTAAF